MSTRIVRRGLQSLLVAVALLIGTGCLGTGSDPDAAPAARMSVSDAYVPEPPGAVAAAYLRITNAGDRGDTLLSVESDASRLAELHETVMDGASVSMRAVESLAIPAGETIILEPGGLHVMLIEPVTSLEEGKQVRLILTFEVAGDVEVLADVVGTGAVR